MKAVLGVAAAFVALLLVAAVSQGCLIVDVHAKEDGVRVFVPAPLFLADVAMLFIPDQELRIETDAPEDMPVAPEELAEAARKMAAILEETEDGVLVHVEDGSDNVLISKVGEGLQIDVRTQEEEVFVRAPFTTIVSALKSFDGETVYLPDLLDAVQAAPSGRLVEVHTPDADVKITLW